jgi:predicted SAM-dependent methyltransferase
VYNMGVLTKEQLDEVWRENGLERRMKRFHRFLIERGLLPMSVPEHLFLDHLYNEILVNFFVKGVKEHEDGRIEYGSDR